MISDPLDRGFIDDILAAAEEIEVIVGKSGETYRSGDFITRRALEKCLLNLGEATARLSRTFKEQHPQIPWDEIVGLRNVLAHVYGGIDYAKLWAVAAEDVPNLAQYLKGVFQEGPWK